MKCSLGMSNFLEEISSLSHSVVSLYFFALITEEGFLISPCYSLELCFKNPFWGLGVEKTCNTFLSEEHYDKMPLQYSCPENSHG